MLVVDAYPRSVSTSTLVNVLTADQEEVPKDKRWKSIQKALGALAKAGVVTRREGENRLIVNSLPETGTKGLKALRGHMGRRGLKREGNPTPVKSWEAGKKSSNLMAITVRFPKDIFEWLNANNMFEDLNMWAQQLPNLIKESPKLTNMGGKLMTYLEGEVGVDNLEGLLPGDAVLLQAVDIVYLANKKNPVGNIGGFIRSVLTKVSDGNEYGTDWEVDTKAFKSEPYGERNRVAQALNPDGVGA